MNKLRSLNISKKGINIIPRLMNIKRNILKHGTKTILVENFEAIKNYAQENINVIANNINNL